VGDHCCRPREQLTGRDRFRLLALLHCRPQCHPARQPARESVLLANRQPRRLYSNNILLTWAISINDKHLREKVIRMRIATISSDQPMLSTRHEEKDRKSGWSGCGRFMVVHDSMLPSSNRNAPMMPRIGVCGQVSVKQCAVCGGSGDGDRVRCCGVSGRKWSESRTSRTLVSSSAKGSFCCGVCERPKEGAMLGATVK
jgi:hypothetical protein